MLDRIVPSYELVKRNILFNIALISFVAIVCTGSFVYNGAYPIVIIFFFLPFFRHITELKKLNRNKSILDHYAVEFKDNCVTFPEFGADFLLSGTIPTRKTIELSNIASAKKKFGRIVIKLKDPSWADKIKYPVDYLSKAQINEILARLKYLTDK